MSVSKNAKLIRAWRNELQSWCDEHGVSIKAGDGTELEISEAVIEMPLVSESVAGIRLLLDGLRADECRIAGESGPYEETCYFWAELVGPCGTVVVGFGEELDWYLDELASWIPDSAYAEVLRVAHSDRIHDDHTLAKLTEAARRIFSDALRHAPEEVHAFVPVAAEQAAAEVAEELPLLHLSAYANRPGDIARFVLRDFPGLAKLSKDERRDIVFMALRAMDAKCVDSYGVVAPVIEAVDAAFGETST